MRSVGVAQLKRGPGNLVLILSPHSTFDRGKLVEWVTKERKTFSFLKGEIFSMRLLGESPEEVLSAAKSLLNRFDTGGNM
jgi:hypothetical protein